MRKKIQGFTLIELMAVVIIVAILSVVAVVSYSRYQAKARLMAGYGYINEIRTKQEMYYSTYSQYVSTGTGASALTNYYPFPAKNPVPYKDPGYPWGIDCSNTGGNAAAEGFCALGFSPGAYTNWAFVTVGWYPGISSANVPGCIHDSSRPWFVIRALTAGNVSAGAPDIIKDCYHLQATSEAPMIAEIHCKLCQNITCDGGGCK